MSDRPLTFGAVHWRESQITKTKQIVKAELDAHTTDADAKGRLDYILERIRQAQNEESQEDLLRRFVFIVSALVHHERHGGLGDRDVKKMLQSAEIILQTQGIRAGKSKLSFLYGELHLIMSQIYRQKGEHWRAAWELQQCVQQAKPEPPGGALFQALSMGNRLIRLGHASLSIDHYRRAESAPSHSKTMQMARLGRIRALRLRGDLEEAQIVAQDTKQLGQLDHRVLEELNWELVCIGASQTGDFTAMVETVGRGAPHYGASYVVEAFLWAKCSSNGDWTRRLSTMKTIARNKALRPQSLGATFGCAQGLEEACDLDFPLRYRQQRLADILSTTADLLSIDKELLVWAAASRILASARSWHLATIAIKEYQSLCRRLSDGRCDDTLKVTQDLVTRSWFEGSQDDDQVA